MKICPLQYMGAMAGGEAEEARADIHRTDCWEEQCAWWDAEDGKCAVLMMAQRIRKAHHELASLGGKIGGPT